MSALEPDPQLPRRKPSVRLWLVAVLLFGGGFVGRLVLEAQPDAHDGYLFTMIWQMGWYAAGLVTWWVWWITQGREGKTGCGIGIVLALAAVFAVMSSSPH